MCLKVFVTLVLLGVISCYGNYPPQPLPIVDIRGLGQVVGSIGQTAWTGRTIYKFQAIHYALAPVGYLRFQPPVGIGPWFGIKDATHPGVRCPQITETYVNVDNEDCLTLSVFSNDLSASRPVMVFIHGGFFYTGGADAFQPDYLLESDVVLVVIQYRLGPLGFLSTMSERIPGNAGILDVISALEWVQQHIWNFGGDRSLVTIFGQSAGAATISLLLRSPLVQTREIPLFHRAIMHSGSMFNPRHLSDASMEGTWDIARRMCPEGYDLERCFCEAPVINLLAAFLDHRAEAIRNQGLAFVTASDIVIGGPSGLFPYHPLHYLGVTNPGIAVMAGTVSQDGLYLLNELYRFQPDLPRTMSNEQEIMDYIRILHEKFGPTSFNGALESYAFQTHILKQDTEELRWGSLVTRFTDICATSGLKAAVLTDVVALSRINPGNIYLYSFDYSSSLTKEKKMFVPFPYKGAVQHEDDLQYLFPLKQMNADDEKMAKLMVQLWTSFAIDGVPRAKEVPSWLPMKTLIGPYLKIDSVCEQKTDYRDEFTATSRKYAPAKAEL
nr:glutactin-like [Aedes albopictus]